MNTRWIKGLEQNTEQDTIREAGAIIRAGGLVAFPTETVYGLGGDALNAESSRKIYEAKGRPSDNPLIIHIAKLEDLEPLVKNVPRKALLLAKAFWPGPLTMVFQKSSLVPYETTGGLETVAVRLPNHPVALSFIEAAGGFVAAPSANASGRPSPTLARHVYEDLQGRIEMILDGGAVGIGIESTIIDMTEEIPIILRPGSISEGMIEELLGKVNTDPVLIKADTEIRPKAPGMKYRHYAPKGELVIIKGQEKTVQTYINNQVCKVRNRHKRTGVICTDETYSKYNADAIISLGRRSDEEAIARMLYQSLREFDSKKIDFIYSEDFSESSMGQAIMNRLLKAAGHKIILLKETE